MRAFEESPACPEVAEAYAQPIGDPYAIWPKKVARGVASAMRIMKKLEAQGR